jgi:pblB-like tail protein|nr:MAG TPA: Minor structural protein [Caudoviricetes sp.]
MYNINQNYQKAINAPSRRIRGRVTIKNKVLSDGVSSIDYISSITGNEMSIGSTNTSTVDIKFKTLIEGLQERELIKVSFTIETESGLVERQIGEFYLTEIKLDRNNKTTAVKAVDKMAFLNDQFKSTISYPALGKNIVQEIVNDCNLRVNNNLNISNLPSFDKKLEKVSYREMLGYLAQTVGAFVVFNNRGELEFRKLIRTEKRISKSAYLLKGLEVDEVEFRINGISVDLKDDKEKKILVMGSPLGTQVNLSNPLMTQGVLNSIYSEYKNLRFNPFKLNWRGDPFVEVGDWVSIEVSNGTYKAFPILSLKISFSGGLKSTISANVKGTASLTTEYKGTVQRQIEFINARLGSTGNLVYADTTEPKNPSEGDVWFKPNGAFTDLYIFEKGKWVLKTSTGDIEGVVTQITKSEILTKNFAAAIAKIIELDANRITTGSLSFEKLSSKAVNSIREGLITKSKLSELLATDEGIHQILLSEVNKEIEKKKPELKGKDGKIPAFNQLIGTRFPTLDVVKPVGNTQLKLNKKDYNNQSSIEILPNASNEVQGFSLKANIRDIAPGRKYIMRIPMYIFSDSGNDTIIRLGFPDEEGQFHLWLALPLIEVSKGENKWVIVEKEMPIGSDIEVQQFVKSNFAFISTGNAHFKIAEPYIAVDDVKTDKWLPAIEDMQSYSLTASARIEGIYLNENLMNCKVYLDVYSNGEIVRASTTETPLKIEIKKLVASGYTATGEVTLDSNGLVQNINIPNGKKDGQPIEVVFEVTCGENKTVASARLNNTIDKQLLTETISKVKAFESTIDKFESKIGEINKQKFKMAYNIENICSESGVEKKGNDLYFNTKTPLKKDKEYYVLADLEDVPENQKVGVFGTKIANHIFATNGLNVWRVTYAGDQTKINIYPLGTNTKVKNVEIYEVPEFEAERVDIINYTQGNYNGNSLSIYAKGKLEISKIYTLEFEVVNEPPQGSFIAMYENTKTNNYFKKKTLVKGVNKLTFRNNTEYNAFGCTIKENLQLRNVKFYKEDFNVGYKNEYNISEMESRIEQTKNQIEHAVKEDNFGTLLTQNAYHLRLAWNNISKFIQFEYGDIAFYEKGEITENKLTAKLTDTGYQFWRDGYHLGNMGANRYIGDESKKGIVFDLEYDGWFMGWGYKKTRDANQYTWKWLYSSGSFASYDANTLNAGCDIDMHWNKLRKASINLDEISIQHTITSGFHFALPTSFTSDGRASEWFNGCYLEFKNGILINATMPQ